MKNLVYIGNKLSSKGKTESTIDTLGKHLEQEGFNLLYASTYSNQLLRFLDMLWTVFRNRKSTDYVLIDTYSTLNFYYAYAVSQLCRLLKLKYIPILHGGELPMRLKESPKLSRAVFSHAFKNVSPSHYLKHHFKENDFNNVVFIPNSIKIENYRFHLKTYESINLLWVRSFAKIYNPALAVKVLKALKNQGIEAKLCMVGPEKDGSLETTKKLAKDLKVDVEFTGKLTKAAWHKKSRAFNIFINTTTIDNTPVSVIEAMALGLPVISTNVGGMPFLIENKTDGLLVESNRVEDFVLAIKEVSSRPVKSDKIAENARKKVENYDWGKVKHQWHNLLG